MVNNQRQADGELGRGSTEAAVSKLPGITDPTRFRWWKEYGGMKVAPASRLMALERENFRLKRPLPEQQLEIQILKEIAGGRSTELIVQDWAAPGEHGIVRHRATCKGGVWSLYFFSVHTADGHPLGMLLMLGDCSCECLAGALHRLLRRRFGKRGHNARHHEETATQSTFGGRCPNQSGGLPGQAACV